MTYSRFGVEVFSNRQADDTSTDLVVLGVHGDSRDAEGLCRTLVTATANRALIICPLFRTLDDPFKRKLATWTDDGWKRGDPSTKNVSSFTVAEKFLAAFQSRPLVAAGHSAGGQFWQRWAYVASTPTPIVVANPGSYMWHTTGWAYKYGLDQLPTQMTSRTVTDRPFTLLLGTEDTDPNDPSLDQSTAAKWQGQTRYDRGMHYCDDHKRTWTDVPGVGHTASGMFTSPEGSSALLKAGSSE